MLTQNYVKEVLDYRDGQLFWRNKKGKLAGSAPSNAYAYWRIGIGNRIYTLHKIIYFWHTGEFPKLIDHKNGNKLDNRIENLRPATKQENEINSNKSFGNSGFRGVSKIESTGRFRAYIVKDNKQIHIGVFPTPQEAFEAFKKKREQLFPGIAVAP